MLGKRRCCDCGPVASCYSGCGCINVATKIRVDDSTLGLGVDLSHSTSSGSNPWGRATSWGGVGSYSYPGDGTEDGCQATTVPVYYNLNAANCTLSVGWYADVDGTECPLSDTSNPSNFISFDAPNFLLIWSSCDPFERTYDYFDWTGGPSTDGTAWNVLYNSSQTSLAITSPYATSQCCVRFVINGCNGRPLPGATVKVWTNSSKATPIGEGVTDSLGGVIIDVHSHGSIYYEASSDRFVTGNRTVTVSTCGNSVGILTLLPASGYHCHGGGLCAFPWKDTLFASDLLGNTTTLVYDGTGTPGWKGTTPTFNYPGCHGCPSVPNFSYDILFTGDIQLQWTRDSSLNCPGTTNPVGFSFVGNNLNFICPPVGATVTEVVTGSVDTNNLFCSTLGDHDFIITE